MGLSGTQIQTWRLLVCLSWMCVGGTMAELHYMVAVPAVIEAGAEAQFCASLLQPNETVVMTVTLISKKKNTTLLKQTASEEFHACTYFQAPVVKNQDIQKFQVEVRGDTFYAKKVKKVMFKVYKPMTFVQTDKPIYLPGQTVHFRVVTLDNKFRAASRRYNSIHIQDVNSNLIGQWQNKTSKSKILQLSYSLNTEAPEGLYRIIVSFGKDKVHHSFKVEKYVLPKFDVKIEAPDKVSIGQEQVQVKVCAKYTYGQTVPGNVEFQMCRPLMPPSRSIITVKHSEEIPGETAPCFKETKQTDRNGCATFAAPMSSLTKFDEKLMRDHLHLKATMEEEGTGVSHLQKKEIQITYAIGELSFIDTPTIYHPGVNIEGKVKAVHHNNTPIADMKLYLSMGHWWPNRLLSNLTTDGDGVASFSVNTESIRGGVQLHIHNEPTMGSSPFRTPYYETGILVVSMAQASTVNTKSVSSLEVKKKDHPLPCDREEEIFIHYTVVGEKQGSVHVMYLVLSRGAIIMQGFKQVEVQDQSVSEGEVSFKLTVTPDSAPHIQVLAYAALPSEIVMAHSADFPTEKCFGHKVSLEFSPSSAVPGEETTLQLTAQPNSLCGVSAVDQSVLLKEPGKTLTAEKIFHLLPVAAVFYIPYEVHDPVECLRVRSRRYIMPHPFGRDDAYTVFQTVGMKMATNLFMRTPSCLMFRGINYHRDHYGEIYPQVAYSHSGVGSGSYPDTPIIKTVRSFFPETWIWDLVEVGETGEKDVSFTVPDTITTWETEAFCLSPQGFGLAPRKEITVFQPFFLELTLPYSIIRGEHFELKATVFNYLSSCIMVTVSSAPSLDYTLTPLPGDQYTSCLCANERKTFRWSMAPSVLGVVNVTVSAEAVASDILCGNEIVNVPDRGRIDVVTRSLIVKAEGTEVTKTHNWLLCPKGEALTEELDLHLPENVIDGSARASLSVLGDILGRALKNLDGLLRMPYGCGEQNMALLAPNIYILQYLKNTQQLTPAILEKATNFLSSGYQRQLNYKHRDGAYSTFGREPGNTWLTAFVVRCFAKAQSFVYIDPKNIKASEVWLKTHQKDNGCFVSSGKLFHNRMKGGVSDEVTLSAYVTAAFLEMNISDSEEVMRKSLSCLKESIGNLSNTYTTALLAYVFTLAGDMETRGHLLQHLDTVAVKQGGLLHWSQTAADTSASLSVEISSYVMLAKLSASPSTEDLGYASGIVRWLTSQQNHYGGFSSTQDTVVALQALALYATLAFSPEGSSTVTVQSPSGQLTFDVNHNNKLLYQEKTLPDVTGKYSLEVKGTACAAVQISLHYNIPTPTDITTLSVEVQHEAVCTSRSQRPKLTLKFKSLYKGEENSTNMVILDIKMLSGFVPDPESLKQLGGALLVDRVEQKQDHVMVYIRELPKDTAINHSLELIQELPVQNLKPAVVKIYDYYQPSDQAETQYIYPCAAA